MEKKLLLLLLIPLLCYSCSVKEEKTPEPESKTATLIFSTTLKALPSGETDKQTQGDPCAEGTPFFADIVISQEGAPVAGTMDDPMRLEFTEVEGKYFTKGSSALQLDPGPCVLEYFSILDQAENIVSFAPMQSDAPGDISNIVNNPLPMNFDLEAGTQQYLNVEVVCFDDRTVNSFGYYFSTIQPTEAIDFCIFGNFCDENGRHGPPQQYLVSVWKYSGNPESPKGEELYLEEPSQITESSEGEPAAVPLCLSLPDSQGEDNYYVEIYLNEIIRSGIITDVQVRELFVGEDRMEYFHFREGNCNLGDSPDLF